MGNMNKVAVINESKFQLKAELISNQVRVPLVLPYNQKVEFEVGTFHKRNVITLTYNNGELFGVTYFNAESDDSDNIKITDNDILFNGKSRKELWDKQAIEKWLSSA